MDVSKLGDVFVRCVQENFEKRLLASSCLSVRPSVRIEKFCSHWTDFYEICWGGFFEKLSRKIKFHENRTRITGTLHEHQNTFLIISRSVLLTTRNVSDQNCKENQNTYFVFDNIFWKILSFMR